MSALNSKPPWVEGRLPASASACLEGGHPPGDVGGPGQLAAASQQLEGWPDRRPSRHPEPDLGEALPAPANGRLTAASLQALHGLTAGWVPSHPAG